MPPMEALSFLGILDAGADGGNDRGGELTAR
jgi:hypothetical protein